MPADWLQRKNRILEGLKPSAHQELIDVHAGINSNPSPKVVVKFGLLERLRSIVSQELCQTLGSASFCFKVNSYRQPDTEQSHAAQRKGDNTDLDSHPEVSDDLKQVCQSPCCPSGTLRAPSYDSSFREQYVQDWCRKRKSLQTSHFNAQLDGSLEVPFFKFDHSTQLFWLVWSSMFIYHSILFLKVRWLQTSTPTHLRAVKGVDYRMGQVWYGSLFTKISSSCQM